MMIGEKFDSFKSLRKKSYSIIKNYREDFVVTLLAKHGIKFDKTLPKRKLQEFFQEHQVKIKSQDGFDSVSIKDELIAIWVNQPELSFNKEGKLVATITVQIKEPVKE